MRFIDLRAGIGGFSKGFMDAGFEPAYAIEPDDQKRKLLLSNLTFLGTSDTYIVEPHEIPRVDVAIGNFVNSIHRFPHALEICKAIFPRALVFEFSGKLGTKAGVAELSQIIRGIEGIGYKPWTEMLDAIDFGLPHLKPMLYIVAFRNDYIQKFISFPFPEPTVPEPVCLRPFLDIVPDAMLVVDADGLDVAEKRNERNKSKGRGYRTKTLSPDDVGIGLSRYCKGDVFFVNDGIGPRRLSVPEFKRIMGFDQKFSIPLPRSSVYELMGVETCPPVAKALADELSVWMKR